MPAFQRVLAGFDPVQRAGLLSAAASVGPSLYPGLRPRSTQDQVIATGLIASLNYGLEATSASLMRGLAMRLAGGRRPESALARTGVMLAASGMVAGTGIALQRTFSQKHAEPLRRAALRSLGWRMTRGAAVTAIAGTVLGGLEALENRPGSRFPWTALPVMAPIGGFVASLELERAERRARGQTGEPAPTANVSARNVALGAGAAVALSAFGSVENFAAGGLARGVRKVAPRAEILAAPIGHAVVLGAIAAAGTAGLDYVMRSAENGGNAVEAAYHDRPEAPGVSGSAESLVSFDDIGREGRRFVNMALTRDEIESVVGGAVADPIRVFVGLASADDADARAYLAFQELERTGAFEREYLCFASPTGTGYVNPQAIETLEYLARGDCATVAMQYSLRPSPLSLDRVDIAVRQNRALLHLISGRLAAMTSRPRLLLFGESLGAQSMQDVFAGQGARGMVQAGADAGLFLGTPALTDWVQQWRAYPDRYDPEGRVVEVANTSEWEALEPQIRDSVRFVLLSNHDDPIVKFSPDLLVQAPEWLGPVGSRPPGVPQGASWRPFSTFVLTAIDAKNGMDPIPGQFVASGHDYRMSLGRMTQQVYGLSAAYDEMLAVEKALREREEQWASRRIVTQQLAMAREAIQQQVRAWNPSLDVSAVLDSAAAGPGVP